MLKLASLALLAFLCLGVGRLPIDPKLDITCDELNENIAFAIRTMHWAKREAGPRCLGRPACVSHRAVYAYANRARLELEALRRRYCATAFAFDPSSPPHPV